MQCSSCGGDCGHTKKLGCQYKLRQGLLDNRMKMIPIRDVMELAADAGAEFGAMEGKEFAVVLTPEQLYTMCHLIFEMGKVSNNAEITGSAL